MPGDIEGETALEGRAAGPVSGLGVLAVAIAVLVSALLFPFLDRDYSVNYQYDTHAFATHVAGFRQALATGDLAHLPPLEAWPPYLDAYDVLLTSLTAGTAAVGHYLPGVARRLPTVAIQTHFWERWMSLGFHAAGMALLFLTILRIYARPLAALALTLLVALAPTVIAMDLGRNDWGVLGCLCAVLYGNVCVTQGDRRTRVLAGLGIAAGMLLTMKVNGPAFAVFVASPAVVLWWRGGNAKALRILLGAFALTMVVLSFRQLYYIADFPGNFVAQLADLQAWSVKSPKSSLFYYSWEILASQGVVYRVLVWASVPVVLASLALRRSLTTAFVLASFGIFVGWSLVIDYGFTRGGYHLLPLFVLMIATALAGVDMSIRTVLRRPWLATFVATLGVTALLAHPVAVVAANYLTQSTAIYDRPAAILLTRVLPARWLTQAYPPGTRVATPFSTDLSFIPSITEAGFVFDESLFVKPTTLFSHEPPALATLRATADLFMLTDFQQRELLLELTSGGHGDRAAQWRRWLDQLRQEVPSLVFSSADEGYYYRTIEMFDLSPTATSDSMQATLDVIDDPVRVRYTAPRALAGTAGVIPTAGEPWEVETHEGSSASVEHAADQPGRLHLSIGRLPALEGWYVRLQQRGFAVRGGQPYVLTFRARASRPRRLAAGVGQDHEPWQALGVYVDLELATDWRRFEYPFVASASDDAARVFFDAGSSDIAFDVEEVELRDGRGAVVRPGPLRP